MNYFTFAFYKNKLHVAFKYITDLLLKISAPKATNAGIVSQSAAVGTQVSNSGVMTPASNSGVMTPPMTDEAAPAAKLDKQPINWDRDYGSDQDNSQ